MHRRVWLNLGVTVLLLLAATFSSLVLGGLMILNPWISLLSVPLIIGIYLLLLGVDCLILAFSKLGTRY